MKRIHVVETPAATSPERPSYEELLAALKALADAWEEGSADDERVKARALIVRAGG